MRMYCWRSRSGEERLAQAAHRSRGRVIRSSRGRVRGSVCTGTSEEGRGNTAWGLRIELNRPASGWGTSMREAGGRRAEDRVCRTTSHIATTLHTILPRAPRCIMFVSLAGPSSVSLAAMRGA